MQVEVKRLSRVLLVDDQKIIGDAVKKALSGEEDIELLYVDNPVKALQAADAFHPTVILLDLVMPEMDGLILLKFFRAHSSTRDVPVVLLSSTEEAKTKAEAFTFGANDYIVKLPEKIELVARIRYHSRAFLSKQERDEAYDKLIESQTKIEADLSDADYITTLLPKPLMGDISCHYKFVPSLKLGGDMFNYYWIDDRYLVCYLLDVCGHGVGAALLSVTIANFLKDESAIKSIFTSPQQVLSVLNREFPMEKHHQMFFTLWYGVYDKDSEELTFSSGGHPPALLVAPDGKIEALGTDDMLIGGVAESAFQEKKKKILNGSHLLVFSDGVYELEEWLGGASALEQFKNTVSSLAGSEENILPFLWKKIVQLRGGESFADDASIVEIIFRKKNLR